MIIDYYPHSAQKAPEPFRICGIFTDTTSKVANFAPPKRGDKSARLGDNLYLETFPPWSMFANTDIFSGSILELGRYFIFGRLFGLLIIEI